MRSMTGCTFGHCGCTSSWHSHCRSQFCSAHSKIHSLSCCEESYNNLITWFKSRMAKEIDKRKSKRGKQSIEESFKMKLANIEKEKGNIINLFKVSRLLSQAKQMFINKYNTAVYTTKHFVDNSDGTLKVTAPEGYVAVSRDGGAVKLVDRLEFSRANFAKDKPGS